MDHQITTEDLEFKRWLDSKEGEQHWEKECKGEKAILRSGWKEAQQEYNRTKGLKEKTEKDSEVWRATHIME